LRLRAHLIEGPRQLRAVRVIRAAIYARFSNDLQSAQSLPPTPSAAGHRDAGREIKRLIYGIVDGIDARMIAGRMRELKIERDDTTAGLEALKDGDKVISLYPADLDHYQADLERLACSLSTDAPRRTRRSGRHAATADLRGDLSCKVRGNRIYVVMPGKLEELLAAPTFMPRSAGGYLMVAREGLEPPTPGL
jgi:hypothetical protein